MSKRRDFKHVPIADNHKINMPGTVAVLLYSEGVCLDIH